VAQRYSRSSDDGVSPPSWTSSCRCDEAAVQSLTSHCRSTTASASHKPDAGCQRSTVPASNTSSSSSSSSYCSHSRRLSSLLQPTVVLRHWNGAVNDSGGKSVKAKDAGTAAGTGQTSRQNNDQDVISVRCLSFRLNSLLFIFITFWFHIVFCSCCCRHGEVKFS